MIGKILFERLININCQYDVIGLTVHPDRIHCPTAVEGRTLIQDEVIALVPAWYDVAVTGGVHTVVLTVTCPGVRLIQGFRQSTWIY